MLEFINDVSQEARKILFENSIEVEFKDGDIVFNEGDFADFMCILVEGEVRILKKEKTIARFFPGDFFGEIGVIQKYRTATAVCVGKTKLLKLKDENLKKIILSEHGFEIMMKFLSEFSQRLKNTTNDLVFLHDAALLLAKDKNPLEILNEIMDEFLSLRGGLSVYIYEYNKINDIYIPVYRAKGLPSYEFETVAERGSVYKLMDMGELVGAAILISDIINPRDVVLFELLSSIIAQLIRKKMYMDEEALKKRLEQKRYT